MDIFISTSRLPTKSDGLFAADNFGVGDVVLTLRNTSPKIYFPKDIVNVRKITSFYDNLISGTQLLENFEGFDVNTRMNIDDSNGEITFIAIRPIKIGDEIYSHYGIKYWISHLMKTVPITNIKYELDFIAALLDEDNCPLIKFPSSTTLMKPRKSLESYVAKFYGPNAKILVRSDRLDIQETGVFSERFDFNGLFFTKNLIGKCENVSKYLKTTKFQGMIRSKDAKGIIDYILSDFLKHMNKIRKIVINGVPIFLFSDIPSSGLFNLIKKYNYPFETLIDKLESRLWDMNIECALMLRHEIYTSEKIINLYPDFFDGLVRKINSKR